MFNLKIVKLEFGSPSLIKRLQWIGDSKFQKRSLKNWKFIDKVSWILAWFSFLEYVRVFLITYLYSTFSQIWDSCIYGMFTTSDIDPHKSLKWCSKTSIHYLVKPLIASKISVWSLQNVINEVARMRVKGSCTSRYGYTRLCKWALRYGFHLGTSMLEWLSFFWPIKINRKLL